MIEEVSNYLNEIRHEFTKAQLDEASVEKTPVEQYAKWFEEAVGAQALDPKAIVVSTVSESGMPSSRVVYNRGLTEEGLKFYTNYQSKKGSEIAQNNQACVLTYWPELERQVRMQGIITPLSAEESDAYFAARPKESQIGAWASDQSSALENREELEEKVKHFTQKFGEGTVPRPPHWGGYLFEIQEAEFWQGRPSRLHDRIVFVKQGGEWKLKRLSP